MSRDREKTAFNAMRRLIRLKARTCRHLADNAAELWVAVSLRELAEEFLERADRVAKGATAGPRPFFGSEEARAGK